MTGSPRRPCITGWSCHKYHFSLFGHVCRDKTRLLSRQTNTTNICCDKCFVATNIILSRQKFCLDKHTFVGTKDLFCRDKHVFCRDINDLPPMIFLALALTLLLALVLLLLHGCIELFSADTFKSFSFMASGDSLVIKAPD